MHGQKWYQNVSLSLARCCAGLKMPGDEQQKKFENHACLVGHLPPLSSPQTYSGTTTQRGIPKCFSCPGDCKELSKKTKRSTYDSGPSHGRRTRPPTSDNSPITKRIRTNETPKCFSNLGDCSGMSKEARRWNSRNQGSSQLTVWQWLTCAHRV